MAGVSQQISIADSWTIPDEVLHDGIFLRLRDDGDVFALFRCAATCNRWRRLIAGSSILRRPWPSPHIGFFAQQCHVTWLPGTSPTDAGTPLAFLPAGRSAATGLGSNASPPLRPLSSLVRDAPDSLDGGVPLASRGSLLLVRLFSGDHDAARLRLAVCDMLAGTCHVLPELLDRDCRFAHYVNSYGHAILSSRPGNGFRVLIIGQDKNEASYYNLHVFLSNKLSWRTPLKCFITTERQAWSMVHAEAVVCRGYAYWLFSSMSNFLILNVDIQTGRVSLTNLLSPTLGRWIKVPGDHVANAMRLYLNSFGGLSKVDRLTTTADGTLLRLCVRHGDGRRLEMWTRQEAGVEGNAKYDDKEWLRSRVIDLKLFEVNPKLEQPTCICLGQRSGKLLIMDGRRRMYIVDLETDALEEVTDQFQGHDYNRIVPVEMDWPRFPARWAELVT